MEGSKVYRATTLSKEKGMGKSEGEECERNSNFKVTDYFSPSLNGKRGV